MSEQEMILGVPVKEIRNRNGFSNVSSIVAYKVDEVHPVTYYCRCGSIGHHEVNKEREFIQTLIEQNENVFREFQIVWYAD